ncbi:hypothetical protein F5Y16DRAFT_398221 [Xylariaceae sp. FL0255]|nr:hypothetical protein F5Y16DRAFT_398221 [Xylariaceae sp. FL0255]
MESTMMESASPTATSSTNRGGRPKDWTDPRTRRLVRLYLFTAISIEKILALLGEGDFCPGKDAANKIKHHVLGNDPRWLRPKNEEEERSRVRGLRDSLRGRRNNLAKAAQDAPATENCHEGLSPAHDTRSLGGTTIAMSHRSSGDDLRYVDAPSFPYQPHGSHLDSPYAYIPQEAAPTFLGSRPFGPRDPNRQDSGLTESTDISITSAIREKLSGLSITRAKRVVKVLKRYTFPANAESSAESTTHFQGGEREVDRPGAGHAVPGDFLNDDVLARRQLCAAGCAIHADGFCWCDEVLPTQNVWANGPVPPYPAVNIDMTARDAFGNTAFHRLAASDGVPDFFMHIVSRALSEQNPSVYEKNTACQTFLHVLHTSWFQQGSRLEELVTMLRRDDRFDVYATDVYGRSFYHVMRYHMGTSVRFPGLNFDIARINRRDAFGMRPMDNRASRNFQGMQRTDTIATMSSIRQRNSPPTLNTQVPFSPAFEKEISTNSNLVQVVLDAINTEPQRSVPSEDSLGRNGFHCLAEVRLDLEHKANPSPITPTGKPREQSSKRKFKEEEEVDPVKLRMENRKACYIDSLILAGVDANQYDLQGNTPLMAFVINNADGTKPEKDDGESVIKALVEKAHANMELRNGQGETALHLAAKNGKPIAVRVLLELGANPHTRNSQGLGVLEVLDHLYLATERDDKHNARFQACRAILTTHSDDKDNSGTYAVQHPTVLQEWGVRRQA